MALLSENQQKSYRAKSSFNWTMFNLDVASYLAVNGREQWRSVFVPLVQGLVTEQADEWSAALGMSFDVQNLYAAQWFDEYMLTFSDFVMTTTETDLNALLQQGMLEGWSVPETERRIGALFQQWTAGQGDLNWWVGRLPQYRLEMIARTETMRASNAGSFNLFRSWKASSKEWMATGDDRTRPTHMEAWGRYSRGGSPGPIPIDDYFQVGGKDMLYPGDPAGGAEETVNCRCAILPVL